MVENSYEEARRKRIEENKKKIQELGISKISDSLAQASNSRNKSQSQQRLSKPKPKDSTFEVRRSSRARNPVPSYRDDVNIDLPTLRKRSRSYSSSWESYLARPLDEVKIASYEERVKAHNAAEDLRNSLPSGKPSFVKSMVRSHVYSCFWLGLPSKFCEDHLSKRGTEDMVLEDEDGAEYGAIYIGKRAGVSGGWRAFALDHKLDDGDALVFELVQPTRFKIYITRASSISGHGCEDVDANKGLTDCTKKKTRGSVKLDSGSKKKKATSIGKNKGLPSSQELQIKNASDDEGKCINVSQRPKRKGKTTR
ncbi:hypothetical protein COLO4_11229 [Corchorus olitorius]|uniref:TF-B3 domain-containing protein n=1 Tax=Corchorus olitorius TaxID=93759 RepID=A0A1R3K5C8_9ROSI|nr:hypothetical protein COLO4_11229 [Corchorus olitorius]